MKRFFCLILKRVLSEKNHTFTFTLGIDTLSINLSENDTNKDLIIRDSDLYMCITLSLKKECFCFDDVKQITYLNKTGLLETATKENEIILLDYFLSTVKEKYLIVL